MSGLVRRSGFLGTRVARRTLANFLTAAMLPVVLSSLTGIWYVRGSLETEALDRVQRTSKSVAMIVLDQLNRAAEHLDANDAVEATGVGLSAKDLRHVRTGRPLLRLGPVIEQTSRDFPSLQMLRRLATQQLITVSSSSEYFWAALDQNTDLDRTSLCLFEVGTWRSVFCTPDVDEHAEREFRALAMSNRQPGADSTLVVRSRDRDTESGTRTAAGAPGAAVGASISGVFGSGDEARLVSRRDVFLGFEWGAASWRLVTAESRAVALAPARSITTSLLLLVVLALVTAFMLAHHQIRRSTEPLEELHEATQRVASGDLETPVTITTRDEYGDLGTAFNSMTGALSRQLQLLQRMDAVDDATLREQRAEAIARTTLHGLATTSHVQHATVLIRGDDHDSLQFTRWWMEETSGSLRSTTVSLSAPERARMLEHPRTYQELSTSENRAAPVHAMPSAPTTRVVFPLLHGGDVLGNITIDVSHGIALDEENINDIRRVADRVALGVSNVRLLGQLDALSTGTLRAFARAIDANSAWTAGHSERVTHIALAIGQRLGLSSGELSALYRGGLMHDVGKIGIPSSILDKAGKLSADERTIIEQHPSIGERILTPIPGLRDTLAIVRSHHERFDGQGYPDRLAGDAIPWLARVLSVADVYDALASDRPYRAGLSHRAAIAMIEGQSGSAFDPVVVDALLCIEASSAFTRTADLLLEEFSVAGFAEPASVVRGVHPINVEEPLALV